MHPDNSIAQPILTLNLTTFFKQWVLSKIISGLTLLFSSMLLCAQTPGRELIQDNDFRRGFILWKPAPGKHVSYEMVPGPDKGEPLWGLSQWSSKHPLHSTNISSATMGFTILSNKAKLVQFGTASSEGADLILGVNSAAEYGPNARTQQQPWVHLLVEQEFESPAFLGSLELARFSIKGKLVRSRNLHKGDYSSGLHAAQFQVFLTVQNRNKQSTGFGDLVWFGIPLYDNRSRYPEAYKSKDFGGTEKFIFTPGGQTYTSISAHDYDWISIDRDILPLMREALEMAWTKGFLSGSTNYGDYAISGMNMGWELPGSFDVEFAVKNLSLVVVEAEPKARTDK